MKTHGVLLAGYLVPLVLAACESTTNPSPAAPAPPPPAAASISVSADPESVVATPSGDPDYPWAGSFNVRIAESGGLSANVNFINLVSGDVTLNFGASEIEELAGTNNVAANGTLRVPIRIKFTGGPEGTAGAFLARIVVDLTDAAGKRHEKTTSVTFLVLGARPTDPSASLLDGAKL
jgi:hypothetical protein